MTNHTLTMFNQFPYSEILLTGLKENLKAIETYKPLSKKITHPPDEERNYALPAVAHLVNDNGPKDVAAFKELMISGLDCKKHPKPPNMNWQLEETLNQKIDSMDEVRLLVKLTGHPEILGDYASLCARAQLLNDIIESDSIRVLFEDVADMDLIEGF